MEQIKNFAVEVIGMTDEEAQSLFKEADDGNVTLKDDAIETLKQKDAKRMKEIARRTKEELKPEITAKHDEGYSKAKKEVLSKFEDDLRKKYGVESEKSGIDLIDDVVSNTKGSDDIKTHPDYLKLERSIQENYVPKDDYEKVNSDFENFKQGVEREKTISKVKNDARKVFRETNPMLSEDPTRAANQEEEFLRYFENFDYDVQEDGNHVIKKDGRRLENQNMNAVNFPEFVKKRTQDLFDIKEQNSKGGTGMDGSGGSSSTGEAWKTKDEFFKSYYKESDPDKRVKMMDKAKADGLV